MIEKCIEKNIHDDCKMTEFKVDQKNGYHLAQLSEIQDLVIRSSWNAQRINRCTVVAKSLNHITLA